MMTHRLTVLVRAADADLASGAFYAADITTFLTQEPGDLGTEDEPVPEGDVRFVAFLDVAEGLEARVAVVQALVGGRADVALAPFEDQDWLQKFRAHHRAESGAAALPMRGCRKTAGSARRSCRPFGRTARSRATTPATASASASRSAIGPDRTAAWAATTAIRSKRALQPVCPQTNPPSPRPTAAGSSPTTARACPGSCRRAGALCGPRQCGSLP